MAEWARLLDWLAEAHVVELDCSGENPKHPKSPGSSNRAAMPETKKWRNLDHVTSSQITRSIGRYFKILEVGVQESVIFTTLSYDINFINAVFHGKWMAIFLQFLPPKTRQCVQGCRRCPLSRRSDRTGSASVVTGCLCRFRYSCRMRLLEIIGEIGEKLDEIGWNWMKLGRISRDHLVKTSLSIDTQFSRHTIFRHPHKKNLNPTQVLLSKYAHVQIWFILISNLVRLQQKKMWAYRTHCTTKLWENQVRCHESSPGFKPRANRRTRADALQNHAVNVAMNGFPMKSYETVYVLRFPTVASFPGTSLRFDGAGMPRWAEKSILNGSAENIQNLESRY